MASLATYPLLHPLLYNAKSATLFITFRHIVKLPHSLHNLSHLSILDLIIVASYPDQHKAYRFLLEIYNKKESSKLLDYRKICSVWWYYNYPLQPQGKALLIELLYKERLQNENQFDIFKPLWRWWWGSPYNRLRRLMTPTCSWKLLTGKTIESRYNPINSWSADIPFKPDLS